MKGRRLVLTNTAPARSRIGARRQRSALAPRAATVACLTAGLLIALQTSHAHADETLPLPLSGAAYRVAQQANAEYDAHHYANSATLAREAIRQRPDVVDLRVLLANALADGGHRSEAIRELTAAIGELGPARPLVERRAQIEAVIAMGDQASDLPGAAGIAARAAYGAYQRKNYDDAIANAQRAIALAPEVERLRYLLVDALSAAGRDSDAYAAAEDAARRFGETDGLRTRRRFIGARLAPDASAASFDARQRNDLAEAERLARRAVSYAPDRRNFRLQLLDVLFARGDMPGVEHAASDAIAADNTDLFAWALRGYARAAQHEAGADDDFAHALNLMQTTSPDLANDGNDARTVRAIIADVWLAQHRPQAVLELLSPLEPAHDDTDAVLALRLRRAKKMMSANHALQTATHAASHEIDPGVRPIFDCHEDEFGASCDLYASDPGFAATRTAEDATQRGDHRAAVAALRDAVAAVPDDPQHRIALIDALIANGDTAEARQQAHALLAAGLVDGMDPLQVAYLAQRAGDSKLAYAKFMQADRQHALPATATGDAGYTALQTHHNAQGAAWLERSIDSGTHPTDDTEPMSPQALLDAQSAHADATRNWGFTASLNYRTGIQNGFAANPTPGVANNWQTGVETYWRPFGSLGERAFEVYARSYENFGVQGSSPSGAATLQAALGARVKPFASTTALFAFERVFPIGSSVRGDWLARAAWSGGFGGERRLDVPSWWTGLVYGETGHYLQHPSTYATANARFGRTFRVDALDPRLTVFPHLVAGADYDSAIDHSVPVGVGAGVAARFWFRGGPYDAPRSYVDVSLQYRVRVAGDGRARGVFFGTVFAW
jgi:tetratricopeptide (TPR) repeat protein